MPQRQTPGLRSTRAPERGRSIASSLALPEQRAGLIAQSHERCQAQGLSRIERPGFPPLGRSDLTVVMDRNRRLHTHAAPVLEMLFGVLASIIVMWFSRQREFRADAGAAKLAGRDKMIAALERLSRGAEPQMEGAMMAFGINGKRSMSELFMSHPPIEQRIAALRG